MESSSGWDASSTGASGAAIDLSLQPLMHDNFDYQNSDSGNGSSDNDDFMTAGNAAFGVESAGGRDRNASYSSSRKPFRNGRNAGGGGGATDFWGCGEGPAAPKRGLDSSEDEDYAYLDNRLEMFVHSSSDEEGATAAVSAVAPAAADGSRAQTHGSVSNTNERDVPTEKYSHTNASTTPAAATSRNTRSNSGFTEKRFHDPTTGSSHPSPSTRNSNNSLEAKGNSNNNNNGSSHPYSAYQSHHSSHDQQQFFRGGHSGGRGRGRAIAGAHGGYTQGRGGGGGTTHVTPYNNQLPPPPQPPQPLMVSEAASSPPAAPPPIAPVAMTGALAAAAATPLGPAVLPPPPAYTPPAAVPPPAPLGPAPMPPAAQPPQQQGLFPHTLLAQPAIASATPLTTQQQQQQHYPAEQFAIYEQFRQLQEQILRNRLEEQERQLKELREQQQAYQQLQQQQQQERERQQQQQTSSSFSAPPPPPPPQSAVAASAEAVASPLPPLPLPVAPASAPVPSAAATPENVNHNHHSSNNTTDTSLTLSHPNLLQQQQHYGSFWQDEDDDGDDANDENEGGEREEEENGGEADAGGDKGEEEEGEGEEEAPKMTFAMLARAAKARSATQADSRTNQSTGKSERRKQETPAAAPPLAPAEEPADYSHAPQQQQQAGAASSSSSKKKKAKKTVDGWFIVAGSDDPSANKKRKNKAQTGNTLLEAPKFSALVKERSSKASATAPTSAAATANHAPATPPGPASPPPPPPPAAAAAATATTSVAVSSSAKGAQDDKKRPRAAETKEAGSDDGDGAERRPGDTPNTATAASAAKSKANKSTNNNSSNNNNTSGGGKKGRGKKSKALREKEEDELLEQMAAANAAAKASAAVASGPATAGVASATRKSHTTPDADDHDASVAASKAAAPATAAATATASGGAEDAALPERTYYEIAGVPVCSIPKASALLRPSTSKEAPPKTILQVVELLERCQSAHNNPANKLALAKRAHNLIKGALTFQYPALACAIHLEFCYPRAEDERAAVTHASAAVQLVELTKDTVADDATPDADLTTHMTMHMLASRTLVHALLEMHRAREIKVLLSDALSMAVGLQESRALVWVAFDFARLMEQRGNLSNVAVLYDLIAALARQTAQPSLLVEIYSQMSLLHARVGDNEESLRYRSKTLSLSDDVPRHRLPVFLRNLVQQCFRLGDARMAFVFLGRLQLAERELGSEPPPSVSIDTALALRYLGEFGEAQRVLNDELAKESFPESSRSMVLQLALARCLAEWGKAARAEEAARKGLVIAQRLKDSAVVARARIVLAEVLLWAHHHARRADPSLLVANSADCPKALEAYLEALMAIPRLTAKERDDVALRHSTRDLVLRACAGTTRLMLDGGETDLAIRLADSCNMCSSVDMFTLLRLRIHRCEAAAGFPVFAADSVSEAPEQRMPFGVLGRRAVSREGFEALLRDPCMYNRRLVCYHLLWDEWASVAVFVADAAGGSKTRIETRLLDLDDEALFVLTQRTALNTFMDGRDGTTREAWGAPLGSMRIYPDAPEWPTHFFVAAFRFAEQHPERAEELRTSATACLQCFYKMLIAPIEDLLGLDDGGAAAKAKAEAEAAAAAAARPSKLLPLSITLPPPAPPPPPPPPTRGLAFVGDGIFARLPYHALHDGTQYLAERCETSSCASLAIMVALLAAQRQRLATRAAEEVVDLCRQPAWEYKCVRAANMRPYSVLLRLSGKPAATKSVIPSMCPPLGLSGGAGGGPREPIEAEDIVVGTDFTAPRPAEPEETIANALKMIDFCQQSGKCKEESNQLYGAVHDPGTRPLAPSVLELVLQPIPLSLESFCGHLTAADARVYVASAQEVCGTWELQRRDLVVSSACGAYAGQSLHETGVPVYRALQYAGAARVLLPVGAALDAGGAGACVAEAVVRACGGAATAASVAGGALSTALREARAAMIASGAPLESWARWTIIGLP